MTQTTSRFFDEIAKLMTDAAGAAQGFRQDAENMFRSQAEKVLRDLDVVQREEFEAVKAMAAKALEENDRLLKRIEALEGVTVHSRAKSVKWLFSPWRRLRPPCGGAATLLAPGLGTEGSPRFAKR